MATKTKSKTTTATHDKPLWRRSASAYIGLYGLAYDRTQLRTTQARELTENLFEFLSQKGETAFTQAEVLAKQAQKSAWKNYSTATDKVTDILPVPFKSKVERMEDEVVELQAKLERMTKAVKPKAPKKTSKTTSAKKTVSKAKAVKKPVAVKTTSTAKTTPAPKAEAKTVEAPKADVQDQLALEINVKPVAVKNAKADVKVETKIETKAETKETVVTASATAAAKTVAETPRHIPYFVEVKRYDPLASEDVVRKIVNHCGIALRSEDARYVACSDESERATVRDSWLKKKLGLEGADADLDKKVLEVCTLMQRDQKKARVTFYYLLAKKERMLEAL